MTATHMSEDQQLMALIKKGNDLAFRQLFDKYWEKLYISAYKILGDQAACEDIVQDIFIDLLERSSKLDIRHVKAFLFQAMRYQVASQIKKIRFFDQRADIIEHHSVSNQTEEYIASRELKAIIDESVEALPDRCREVFCLSRYENLSNKEIAALLGISVLTVDTHIKHALKALRKSVDVAFTVSLLHQML